MRCDECKYWKGFKHVNNSWGNCSIEMGDRVDFMVYNDGWSEKEIETDADFFCAAFEGKDDD